jgi:cation diffusion facilitator CzcD-associated flavoprotein CzcO
VTNRIAFDTAVRRAAFCTGTKRWCVETDRGTYHAKFLINANGYFASAPHTPAFPGIEAFKGEVVHLARLDGKTDLGGKRVILVGSGASAISAAPELCARSRSLTLLQRSPTYIFEESNKIGCIVNLAQRLFERGYSAPLQVVNYFIQVKDDLIFVLFRRWGNPSSGGIGRIRSTRRPMSSTSSRGTTHGTKGLRSPSD